MAFRFEVLKKDPSGARLGRLETPHGVVERPVFMPVGTAATVKGMTQEMLEQLDVRILSKQSKRMTFSAVLLGMRHPTSGGNR